MTQNKENTTIKDGVKFTDSEQARPSLSIFEIGQRNSTRDSASYKKRSKTRRNPQKKGFYDVNEIVKVDEGERAFKGTLEVSL